MKIITVFKDDHDVILFLKRTYEIDKGLFCGKINVLGVREEIFNELKIKDKEQFKESNLTPKSGFYKGVFCYSIEVEDIVYIIPTCSFVDDKKRSEIIDDLKIRFSKDLKIMFDEYDREIKTCSHYLKLLMNAPTEILTSESGMKFHRIIDKNIVPEGVKLNSKMIIFSNDRKIADYLMLNDVLSIMKDCKIGTFDIIEDDKYAYVTLNTDSKYIL